MAPFDTPPILSSCTGRESEQVVHMYPCYDFWICRMLLHPHFRHLLWWSREEWTTTL